MTPLGGLAVMAAEDALGRYVIRAIESRAGNPIVRGLVRASLNPARATANVATGRAAWHRASRPLSVTR